MKNLKLAALIKKDLKTIKGGDVPQCSCSCTCSCQGEDTTYAQNLGMTSGATNVSVLSSVNSSGTIGSGSGDLS